MADIAIVPPSARDFRARLVAARERAKLGHAAMAEKLLTPLHTYMEWESGLRAIPGVAIVAAEALAPKSRAAALREERCAKLMALADGTRTAADVAAAIGIHRQIVYNLTRQLKAAGTPPKFKKTRNDERDAIAVMLRRRGMSYPKIAERLAMKVGALEQIIHRRAPELIRRRTPHD